MPRLYLVPTYLTMQGIHTAVQRQQVAGPKYYGSLAEVGGRPFDI